MHGQNHINEK